MSARPTSPAAGGVGHGDAPFSAGQRVALGLEVLTQYVRVRRLLRRHPLPDVLVALREGLEHPPPRHAVAVDPRRLAFVMVRVLRPLPADTRCLNRSLTLLALLTRRGTNATLVIGVSSSATFGAHAWLELEGVPLLRPWPDEDRLVAL